MARFAIKIKEVHYATIVVEAKSAAEALCLAQEELEKGEELSVEYSHTLDPDEWIVTRLNYAQD